MNVCKTAVAGTMESSDILVTVSQGEGNGISIQLESSVEKQFGQQIREVMKDCAAKLGVENAQIRGIDKGALDCVIRARVETALYRACDSEDYQWGNV